MTLVKSETPPTGLSYNALNEDHCGMDPNRRYRAQIQTDVDDAIRRLGGYWPPLAAVARILEELGEVADHFKDGRVAADTSPLIEEVADIVIISTCLANQYCADLEHEYGLLGFDPRKTGPIAATVSVAHLVEAVSVGGALARRANLLEGHKPLRPGTSSAGIGPLTARLHQVLAGIANVFDRVPEKLQLSVNRDFGRFSTHFDPSTASSLDRFRQVQARTHCVFAPIARMWGCPDWEVGDELDSYLARVLPVFARFCRVAPIELLDGFVLELPGNKYGQTIHELARSLNRSLRYFGEHDTSGRNCMADDIAHTSWQFSFAGVRCFVISFAPCYPESSSRFSFGSANAYFFFQPEQSFEHLKILRGEDKQVRRTIREAFAKHGRPYDSDIMSVPLEAPRYIKPLRVGDPIVKWWEL